VRLSNIRGTFNKAELDVLYLGLPDGRYFTANLAEAGKKPVFCKSVPEADLLKRKCIGVTPKRTNAQLLKLY